MTWRIKEVRIAEEDKTISMQIQEYSDDWQPTPRSVTLFADNLIDLINMAMPFAPDNMGAIPQVNDAKKA